MNPIRLAVVTTHPIQYQAPWFRALAAQAEFDLQVYFCHHATPEQQAEAGFGVEFDWDMPLLDGYSHHFLKNIAKKPSVAGFSNLDTPEIKEIIATEKFDAVIVCGWHFKSAWQAIRACWHTGTPVMVRGDSHLNTRRHPMKKMLKKFLHRSFIPKFDACLAVGKLSREYYLHYGARPERIFLVPHVIDEKFFSMEAVRWHTKRDELRRQWRLEDNKVVFMFAAKFIERKRPTDFVNAIAKAAMSGAPVAGLMVGDGPLRAHCEALAKQTDAPVRFAGFLNQSEVVRAYIAADTFILLSDSGETWGVVVNEAMTFGLPCIVSDQVGCAPDLIVPDMTGHVFPMGNVDALAALIAQYAMNRDQVNEMGRQAQRQLSQYSITAAVEGMSKAVAAVTS